MVQNKKSFSSGSKKPQSNTAVRSDKATDSSKMGTAKPAESKDKQGLGTAKKDINSRK